MEGAGLTPCLSLPQSLGSAHPRTSACSSTRCDLGRSLPAPGPEKGAASCCCFTWQGQGVMVLTPGPGTEPGPLPSETVWGDGRPLGSALWEPLWSGC